MLLLLIIGWKKNRKKTKRRGTHETRWILCYVLYTRDTDAIILYIILPGDPYLLHAAAFAGVAVAAPCNPVCTCAYVTRVGIIRVYVTCIHAHAPDRRDDTRSPARRV